MISKTAEISFLDLPGEARNQIYDLLLKVRPPNRFSSHRFPRLHTQILLVNRQIYHEASGYLYGMNIFGTDSKLRPYLPRFGFDYRPIKSPAATSKISRIRMCVKMGVNQRFDKTRAETLLSGLVELHLYVKKGSGRAADRQVLRLFEDVRGVRKAKVYGCVESFPEYAKWLEKSMMSAVGTHVDPFMEL